MKIVCVSPMYEPVVGGAELHLKELAEGLVKRGHRVTVITSNIAHQYDTRMSKFGGLPERDHINGVDVVRVHPNARWISPVLQKWVALKGGFRSLSWVLSPDGCNMLLTPPRMFSVIPQILRSKADIVVSINWYHPTGYHAYLARCLKPFTLVGIPLLHTAAAWAHRPIFRNMIRQCDALIVNTIHEADFVAEHGTRRVEITGVGVHPEAFAAHNREAARRRYGLGTYPVIGFVGRQNQNKGADVLIEAMKMVWKWNAETRLVLAGNCSPRPDDLDRVLERFSEGERAKILRIDNFPESDKVALYDAFDVFALPSTDESFGISYLEAWLCKKPVVGSRIGAVQCVIHDGMDGLLVEHRNPLDLGEKLITLLSDPETCRLMGERGYQKTVESYTWPRVVDKVERLFLELKSRAHPSGTETPVTASQAV